MNNFPLDEKTWYRKRDDRTDRVENIDGYQNFRVGVIIDSKIKESFSLQCMTLLTCNMLTRWCRRVTIDMPECNSLLHENDQFDFRNYVKQLISKIDPYGKFEFEKINDVDGVLVSGENEKESREEYVWINASGWIAGCGFGNPKTPLKEQGQRNPIGPAFAACMGVAEIFNMAVNKSSPEPYQKWYSLYDFGNGEDCNNLKNPEFCNNFDFGTIYQIGCGAVGSSLDYLISLTNWKGRFYLIDWDEIVYTNCNRSLPFTAYHAIDNKKKIEVCSDVLKTGQREVVAVEKSYNKFTDRKQPKKLPDLILCLANAENVWYTIQHNFPPLTLHATTTANWGINFGRHIPKKEWCILCRFGENLKDNFRPRCEEGVIWTQKDEEILGVLPFLSPAAAVLIMTEMAKMPEKNFPMNDNFINMSLKPQFGHIQLQHSAKKGCDCNEQSLELFRVLRKNSKFWKFTDDD